LNNPEHSPKILKKQTKTQILPIKGILSLFFLINFNVLGQLASLKQYSLKQGLPQSEVSCLFQDSRGLIWIGTRGGGVVEFDGLHYRGIDGKNGLQNDFISDIQEGSDHEILVGQTYSGIQRINKFPINTFPNDWKGYSEFKKIVPFQDFDLGITDKGIIKIDFAKRKRSIIYTFSHSLNEVFCHLGLQNRWVIASEDSGLWIIDTKSLHRSILLKKNGNLRNKKVVGLNQISKESVAITSSDGFTTTIEFSSGWPILSKWRKIGTINLRQNEEITCLVYGIGQHIKWISTSQNRLLSSGNEEIDLTKSSTSHFQKVSCLLLDKNSTLWIGTLGSGILTKAPNSSFSFVNKPKLMNPNLRAVYVSNDGSLLAGGKETGLLIQNKIAEKDLLQILAGKSIYSISESNSDLIIGTEKGILILDNKTFLTKKEFSLPGKVIQLKPIEGNRILVGTYGFGAWILENGKLRKIGLEAPKLEYPYGFEELDIDRFIVPSNTGLWSLDKQSLKITPYQTPDSVGNLFFLSTKDSHGTIWFSTPYGLAGLHRKGWRRISEKDGLNSTLIYTLNGDDFGNIWLGTNRGLDRISLLFNGRAREIRNLGEEEGYEWFESNMRGSTLKNNILYIATVDGLYGIPVKSKVLDPYPIKPVITSFKIGDKSGDWSEFLKKESKNWFLSDAKNILIKKNDRALFFKYSTINPQNPSKVLYSYRLQGFDSKWSENKKENETFFLNLDDNDYVFQVRTTYDGQTYSPIENFSFTIKSPFLLNKWTIIGISFVFFVLLVFVSRNLIFETSARNSIPNKLDFSEKSGKLILLLFLLSYPATILISSEFEKNVHVNKLALIVIFIINLGLIYIIQFYPQQKNRIRIFLTISFFLMILDTGFSVYTSHMAPFHIVALLYISSFSYLVLDKYWQIIAFALFLNIFSLACGYFISNPLYSPVPFQMGATGLSIILVIMHITKKSSEDKLIFANQVVNTGPNLVLGFNKDGHIVFSSSNLTKILGYQQYEIGGRNWWSSVVGKDEDVLLMLKSIVDQKETEFNTSIYHKNGKLRIFKFSCRAIDNNIMVMVGQDFTENQAMQEKFEFLIEKAPDAIYQTDFYGKIVYSNPQTSYILGIENKNIVGKHFSEFVRIEDRESILNFYKEQYRKRIPLTYSEFPVITKNGETRWLGIQVSILMTSDKKVVSGYLTVARDITERLEAEQLIQIQHKNITDSLTYAGRIKQALLPKLEDLKKIFPQAALYKKAKDIIGGDFFWMANFGKKHILVAGDCTGHGVPGAFMTTISAGILRQIIKEESYRNVEEILSFFNRALYKLLVGKADFETPDFVEMAVLSLDFEKNEIHFIGSGIELYRYRDGNMQAFQNGSRGFNFKFDYKNQSEKILLEPGDIFYLFSDGMFDQIGGPQGKRLGKKKFLEIIEKSDKVSLQNGVDQISREVEIWGSSLPQIDDRMLLAFSV